MIEENFLLPKLIQQEKQERDRDQLEAMIQN